MQTNESFFASLLAPGLIDQMEIKFKSKIAAPVRHFYAPHFPAARKHWGGFIAWLLVASRNLHIYIVM